MAPRIRITINSKDLQVLHDIELRAAQYKLALCRAALGKQPRKPVTIKEYSDWEGLPIHEVLGILNIKDYPVQ
ncbi:MAG: hypothetical protein ACXWDO_06705 [Bacteroidia bacterium]